MADENTTQENKPQTDLHLPENAENLKPHDTSNHPVAKQARDKQARDDAAAAASKKP